ncbi:uncharacterized protein LOC129739777 [Uranotaenia lowii]|uniref:uncharacterized protein LOC129739777 n=1 Tax=Uranotaenia lowii TaxID=190385 RepID=UPI00247940C9|nr:uncharacterized protein LOC129739777 [Uranotaenia lowii]
MVKQKKRQIRHAFICFPRGPPRGILVLLARYQTSHGQNKPTLPRSFGNSGQVELMAVGTSAGTAPFPFKSLRKLMGNVRDYGPSPAQCFDGESVTTGLGFCGRTRSWCCFFH